MVPVSVLFDKSLHVNPADKNQVEKLTCEIQIFKCKINRVQIMSMKENLTWL